MKNKGSYYTSVSSDIPYSGCLFTYVCALYRCTVCVLAKITGHSFIHEQEPTSDFKALRGAPFLNSSHSRVRAVDALRSATNLTAPREP